MKNWSRAAALVFVCCAGLLMSPSAAHADSCCMPNGCCVDLSASDCTMAGGTPLGLGTFCGDGFSDNLCINQFPPAGPFNENCDPIVPAIGFAGPTTGCNIGAFPETNLPAQCPLGSPPYDGTPAVWFQITGTGNSITLTTCNPATNFDTVVHVYCNDCTDLICTGGNDDASGVEICSTFTWCSIPGEIYYVLLSNSGAGSPGMFEITATDGAPCANPLPCAPPVGACCPAGGGACLPDLTQLECEQLQAGTYLGDGSVCAGVICTQGACCDLLDQNNCQILDQTACESMPPFGRFFFVGNGTTCTPNPCPAPPTGACCFLDPNGCPDCQAMTELNCMNMPGPGVFQGPNILCTPNLCQGFFPVVCGACCDDGLGGTGVCTQTLQQNCDVVGGFVFLANTPCTPSPCLLAQGRCCFLDGTCQEMSQAACNADPNASFFEANGTCQTACPPPPLTNDTCSTAINLVPPAPFSTSFDNSTATNSAGPAGSCNAAGAQGVGMDNDAWFRWTPTEDCQAEVTLNANFNYDAIMAIYSGPNCGSLTEIVCLNEPDDPGVVEFTANFGETYWFQIGDWGVADGGGLTNLAIQCLDPIGSCCVGAGCLVDTEANCLAQGGQYGGDFTNCTALGACCLPNSSCVLTTASCCASGGGSFLGVATDCGEFRYNLATCSNPFLDISASGIPLVLGDDAGVVVPIGFTFNFFEVPLTSVAVCSNGYLTFGTDLADFTEDPIPDPLDPNDLIAVLWDDLNPAAGGTVHHQTMGVPGDRLFIAQWTAVPEFGGAGANTFQVVLHEIDSSVEFHYQAITIGPGDWTAGVENFDGSDGLDVSTSVGAGGCLTLTPDLPMNPCAGDGACCVGQVCSAPVTPGACAVLGGVFLGLGTDCTGIPCSEGACCDQQGTCTVTTEPNCTGEFQGLLTTCDPNPCVGACCDPTNGACTLITEAACLALPGAYVGDGTTCSPDPCPLPEDCASARTIGATPFLTNIDISAATANGPGATCDLTAIMQNDVWYSWTAQQDGTGIATVTPATFDAVLVVWEGPDCLNLIEVDCQECDDNLPGCPDGTAPEVSIFPVTTGLTYWFQFGDEGTSPGGGLVDFQLDLSTGIGACCVPNDDCQVIGLGTCVLQLGGAYEGDGTACTPSPCAGACCFPDESCVIAADEAECNTLNGSYVGAGTDCGLGVLVLDFPVNGAIPDCVGLANNPLINTQTVIDCGPITDLDVELVINHTWVGDLFITLTHDMSGTTVALLSRPGGAETPGPLCSDNYCCGNASDNINVTLDDDAVNSVETGPFPLMGLYHPDADASGLPGTLSTFNGLDRCSTWTLTIHDGFAPDPGTLVRWALRFEVVANNPCELSGACCLPDGMCQETGLTACTNAGGQFQGDLTLCGATQCSQPGACCMNSGACNEIADFACAAAGGVFSGVGTVCNPNNCPQSGACCLPDATCTEVLEGNCLTAGGEFFGELTTCPVTPCALGACCRPGGCQETTVHACANGGGQYQGDGVTCDPGFLTPQCSDPFEDIAATGTPLNLPDNGGMVVPIGFSFDFYGNAHTDLVVSSNGYVTFGNIGHIAVNTGIPNAAEPNDMIAGLWDDLVPQMGGTIHHETRGAAPNRRFIAQWTSIPARVGFGLSGPNTFQIILFEGSNDIDIRFGDIDVASPAATAGVEKPDGSDGIDASSDIADFACIRFTIDTTGGPCGGGSGCATCPGDMNGSSTLDGIDVAMFINCVIAAQGGAPPPGCGCGDMNLVPDGILNATDVNLFVGVLLSPPSCP